MIYNDFSKNFKKYKDSLPFNSYPLVPGCILWYNNKHKGGFTQ